MTTAQAWEHIASIYAGIANGDERPEGDRVGHFGLCHAVGVLKGQGKITWHQFQQMHHLIHVEITELGASADWSQGYVTLAPYDQEGAAIRSMLATIYALEEAVGECEGEIPNRLRQARGSIRQRVQSAGLIARKADLDVTREPSVVGIDGSYQVHRLTALDLCAAAAVAVEGTSKEARRHWQEPYHRMWVNSFEHSKNATNALRGLMISMELELAAEAPHDLVLLDGSFIVSSTRVPEVAWWDDGMTKDEFEARNVLFQREDRATYIEKLLSKVGGEVERR